MKIINFFIVFVLIVFNALAQDLPHRMTDEEKKFLPQYNALRNGQPSNVLITTPPASPVRTIAEWEELQGLQITWTSYQSMLKEIVRHAKQETKVYIVTTNPTTVINYLNQPPAVDTQNVQFVIAPFNSVWCRDYGLWSAYTNDVDTLITIDWIYNRPRPLDNVIPSVFANLLNTPFYETTTSPWDLVHTGGNFMTDGFGTGFSSNLILTDNSPAGGFNVSHTAAEIDTIMSRFMGINRYIKMTVLPYDGIHHIDMHMKLLDEETLLVGQYPPGVADGPQIEANLQYILNNYNSVFGTPYKVIRIPMPSDGGLYPNNGGRYFTYTNSSFINKTVIVPTYNIPTDTTALRIYREALPGYKIVGINSLPSIGASGALHCITKEIGTDDPLLISHQPLPDTYDDVNPYTVQALMKHRSGIHTATLYYRTDTLQPYSAVPMMQGVNPDYWIADIPAQSVNTRIYYYVEAHSFSGKTQVRPMPAPAGYWYFDVLGTTGVSIHENYDFKIETPFPNPSKGITCIPVTSSDKMHATAQLTDITGRVVDVFFNGSLKKGENKLFVNTSLTPAGFYFIRLIAGEKTVSIPLMVR
jgi:agmatine/peptidylarginine deiminase